jgi:hypothetical protein
LELEEPLQVVHLAGQGGKVVEPAFVEADFALDALGAFGVVPEVGVKGLAGQVFDFAAAVVDVKDTS